LFTEQVHARLQSKRAFFVHPPLTRLRFAGAVYGVVGTYFAAYNLANGQARH
jgi:hypothetical protein